MRVDFRQASSGRRRSAQQRQTDRHHPLVEERRSDGEALAVDRLGDRREHRREQDEPGQNSRIQLLNRNAASFDIQESSSWRARSSGSR